MNQQQPQDILEQAVFHHQSGNLDLALELYLQILQRQPDNIDALHLSGVIYLEQGDYSQAKLYIKRALKIGSHPAFHVNLGNVYLKTNDNNKALQHYQQALQLDPNFITAKIQVAHLRMQTNKLPQAISIYKEVLAHAPNQHEILNNLGIIHSRLQKWDEAIEYFQQAIELNPNFPQALANLAEAKVQVDDIDTAMQCCDTALKLQQNFIPALVNKSFAFTKNKQYSNAKQLLNKVLQLDNNCFTAKYNLGVIANQQGDFVLAKRWLLDAAKIQANNLGLLQQLGNCYHNLGDNKNSEECYKLAIKQGDIISHLNLAHNKLNADDYKSAINLLNAAHRLDVANIEVIYNLATVHTDLQQFSIASDLLKKLLEISPDHYGALAKLYYIRRMQCDWDGVNYLSSRLDTMLNKSLNKQLGETPYINLFRTENSQYNLLIANKWSSYIANNMHEISYNYNLSSKRLRIGYLSNDFHDHATMHLLAGVFRLHNKTSFEIYVYSYGPNDNSEYRAKLIQAVDKFKDVGNLSDRAISDLINQDEVQILIDLKGYSKGARLGIAALRPAPVQICYLGFPGTTGAKFFDYVITDPIVTPATEQEFYTEEFAYLSECYQPIDDQQEISEPMEREFYNLPKNAFVFCSFNQTVKFDLETFNIWLELLQEVSNSVLWLLVSCETTKNNLLRHVRNANVSLDRIIFADKLTKKLHLARLQVADLALDTMTYNGHTTTCDAIYAGLPVVTVIGSHFASRVSASILTKLRVQQLITNSKLEYKQLCLDLASNPDKLSTLRQLISNNLSKFNSYEFTKDYEQLLLTVWHKHGK